MRTYAANLRRTFDATDRGRGLISREGHGYRLRLEEDRIDIFRFLRECRRARERVAAGDFGQAEETLVVRTLLPM
ncbi:hypothetical protein [Micromonospora sp. NPDC048830]|uniref:hypothetical protein n=1 Tax=Micromonospora sp. NPDC048830 TaxID=3364257 RepID=UPI003724A848